MPAFHGVLVAQWVKTLTCNARQYCVSKGLNRAQKIYVFFFSSSVYCVLFLIIYFASLQNVDRDGDMPIPLWRRSKKQKLGDFLCFGTENSNK